MANNINGYCCENYFYNYNSNFSNIISEIKIINNDYNNFILNLENFFNEQLEEKDLEFLKGDIFELSDANENLNFPFCVRDNKLKFVETEHIRSIILSAVLANRMKSLKELTKRPTNEYEENYEQYNTPQL
jgi:hypothetical protein